MSGSDERKLRPITVGQLIAELKQFPEDCRVMVRGYESGYDDPEPLMIMHVILDPFDSSVYGNCEGSMRNEPGAFAVVLINRP